MTNLPEWFGRIDMNETPDVYVDEKRAYADHRFDEADDHPYHTNTTSWD